MPPDSDSTTPACITLLTLSPGGSPWTVWLPTTVLANQVTQTVTSVVSPFQGNVEHKRFRTGTEVNTLNSAAITAEIAKPFSDTESRQ